MKVLGILAVAGMAWSAAASEPAPHFQPMAFLVGHCWEGDIPRKGRDEHCFEWVFGGKFIRDKHTVRGGDPKAGETLYAYDPKKKSVVYTYWTSDGGISTGSMTPEPDRLLFPEEVYEQDGKKLVFRSSWQRLGETRYAVVVDQKAGDQWKEAWKVVYVRK